MRDGEGGVLVDEFDREHEIAEHALYKHYIGEYLHLASEADGTVTAHSSASADTKTYRLRSCVYAIDCGTIDGVIVGTHSITYCRHRNFRRDANVLLDELVDYELMDADTSGGSSCWLMYNDVTVMRVAPDEVLRYDPQWKVPVLLCYERMDWTDTLATIGEQ